VNETITYYLSPNPTTDEVNIICNKNLFESGKIEFYNNLGIKLRQEQLNVLKNKNIYLNNWPSGIYYYKITNCKEMVFKGKIVLNR
jgi:hypothetical protein